nr:MAG TPA: hypothetical protein [Caudoviricetes sp.]
MSLFFRLFFPWSAMRPIPVNTVNCAECPTP